MAGNSQAAAEIRSIRMMERSTNRNQAKLNRKKRQNKYIIINKPAWAALASINVMSNVHRKIQMEIFIRVLRI